MTKEKHEIKATIRTNVGRKVKQLRNEGFLPATIYGHDFESVSIQFNLIELEKIFDEVGESGLVELVIDDKKIPVLFRNPQYHPVTGHLIHIDCYKVNLKEKISTMIPIEFIGESLAVKNGNILVTVTDEIEVEALPTDLPENIEVDLVVLENLESIVTVADLKIDKSKIEILTNLEQVVVKVEEPRAEEEPIAEEVSPEDVEATAQKGDKEETNSEESSENKEEDKEEKQE
ncbi:MAG: 50S ribosomal protein L25 [Candidatus Shapirobacteria bacterium]|nr:50S ribosomal protein L25 [Candidatus Shapirobacteria bacterium]